MYLAPENLYMCSYLLTYVHVLLEMLSSDGDLSFYSYSTEIRDWLCDFFAFRTMIL